MTQIALDALDLAALLCSRVCHDVISPVGAIVNGLEVLDEEKDPRDAELRSRPRQEERHHGVGQAAVLPAGIRSRRLGGRLDRHGRTPNR